MAKNGLKTGKNVYKRLYFKHLQTGFLPNFPKKSGHFMSLIAFTRFGIGHHRINIISWNFFLATQIHPGATVYNLRVQI